MQPWGKMVLAVVVVGLLCTVAWAQEGKSEREDLAEVVQFVQRLVDTGDPIATLQQLLQKGSETAPGAEEIVAMLNQYIANVYRAGQYSLGLGLAKQTQAYAEIQLGVEHLATLASLNSLAGMHWAQGHYSEAEPLFQRILTTRERIRGADHPDTLASLNNLALLYQSWGRYAEAEPLYQRALTTQERVLGTDHPYTLTSLNNMALLYDQQGRYGEAEPLYQRALATRERVLGADHPDTLISLNILAGLYQRQGHYGEAEPLYQRALATRERVLGRDHPHTLISLNGLARVYESQGRYGEAEPLYQRALATRERVLGADHPDTLTSLHDLAGLYHSQGRYGEAEPLFQRALATRERVLGTDHPATLASLNNLAGLYKSQGRYEEVEPLLQRALATRERVLGTDHPATLASLNNLAFLYERQGRYGEAEPPYQRALATFERTLGTDHPDTLTSLNNLAGLYERQGRYGEAEPLYQRALTTRERVLGRDHLDTLASLNNLAGLYEKQGRYEEAEPLFQRVSIAHEHVLGRDHPHTLTSLNNLALLYDEQGRYEEAEPLYQRALATHERVLGAEHPDTLASLNNLAALYQAQGRYGEAEPLYQRVLATRERTLGAEHPDTLPVQLDYVALLAAQQQPGRALQQLKSLEPRLLGFAGTQLHTTLQEQVRRRFLVSQSSFQDVVYTLAVQHPTLAEAQTFAADVLLRWKQVQRDEDAYLEHLIRTSDDTTVTRLGQEIRELRRDLSHLVHVPQANPEALRERQRTLEAKEVALAQHSRRYKKHLAVRGVRLDDVRTHLPQGSALLELRVYNPYDFTTGKWGDLHWLALLLPAATGGEAGLVLQDLGPVADSAQPWRALLQSDDRDSAAQLYHTLFGALDERLQAFAALYIAPDGFLHLVALTRLVLPDGRYWMERQTLRQLQTGRDLIPEDADAVPKGLIALGGIDYEDFVGPSTAMASPQQQETHRQLANTLGALKPLGQSGPEAESISQLYWDAYGGNAEVWKDRQASEARLKALTTPPRVLHLATHGFYLPAAAESSARPLTLSGLALAGANKGMQGHLGSDGEDGILYALEVQNLNLEGTELVVLSACDTGKGELDYSDGVYGLVRAFRVAGARRVLMTLWPVQDAHARVFMLRFYKNWLTPSPSTNNPNRDPIVALQQTRLAFLHDSDPALREPRVWAPYVLVETRAGH